MEAKQKKRIIINADDFGYCNNRNAGIVKAFKEGLVSSVSLLVNGSSTIEAVHLSKEHGIPMGLHLNLTEGTPIYPGHNSLVATNGFLRGKLGFRESLKSEQIDLDEIRTEIKAQLTWFLENTGSLPSHVDGHQHIHVIPQVAVILAEQMKQFKISKTRNPAESIENCSWIQPARKQFHFSVIQDAKDSYGIFEKAGISFPGNFIGLSTMGKDMTYQRIQTALLIDEQSRPGLEDIFEFMVHPGYRSNKGEGGCGEGPDNFSLSPEREHELGHLLNQDLCSYLNEEGFEVCSFYDI